eukprot:c16212_g1_i1 orf=111-1022(+)
MTLNFVLDCFESLWLYGLPSSTAESPLNYSTTSHQLSFSRATLRTPSTCPPNLVTLTLDRCSSRSFPLVDQEPGLLHRLFDVLDEDGDGRLSLREMCSLVAKLSLSSSHSDDLLSLIHSTLLHCPQRQQSVLSTLLQYDDLSSLDFPQFTQLYASLFNAASQHCPTSENPSHQSDEDVLDDELLDAFHVYDTNRDGFISADELAAVLLQLGLLPSASACDQHHGIDAHLGACQAYIQSVDLDGNGMVDLQEFKAMMHMMPSNPPATTSRRPTACSCISSQPAAAAAAATSVKPGQLYPLTCRT